MITRKLKIVNICIVLGKKQCDLYYFTYTVYMTQNNTLQIGEKLLLLSEYLHVNKAKHQLVLIRDLLANLIMQDVRDEKISLIELNEYYDLLIQDLENPSKTTTDSITNIQRLLYQDVDR